MGSALCGRSTFKGVIDCAVRLPYARLVSMCECPCSPCTSKLTFSGPLTTISPDLVTQFDEKTSSVILRIVLLSLPSHLDTTTLSFSRRTSQNELSFRKLLILTCPLLPSVEIIVNSDAQDSALRPSLYISRTLRPFSFYSSTSRREERHHKEADLR